MAFKQHVMLKEMVLQLSVRVVNIPFSGFCSGAL